MVRRTSLLLVLMLLLVTATAALAGGWALISLDAPPGEVRADEPWTVNFTVLQHGKTPTHGFDGAPLSPALVAANRDTGERIVVDAMPLEEVGRYSLEVTFPSEGTWEWTIEPRPFIGESVFEPLTVLPAAATSLAAEPEVSGLSAQIVLRWAALVLAALAGVLVLFQARRRTPGRVQPEV